QILPSIDVRHIYPQVPSFIGEERNIIDLLSVTTNGRLVVIEIKASSDPDLPFQALDYWIAVERHRKAGDFLRKGYFAGRPLKDEAALLVFIIGVVLVAGISMAQGPKKDVGKDVPLPSGSTDQKAPPKSDQQPPQVPSLSIDIDLISFDVVVTDQSGNPISGLEKKHCRV